MHYYKFNIADYRKDTGHLSTIEHGIYRQLIDWYYLDEQPIPTETHVIARRLRLGKDEIKLLENVLADFFVLSEAGYKHKRIDAEINDYHAQAEKNQRNGKLGGRPKKTQSVISGNPEESQNNPNHKPLTINQEPLTINQDIDTSTQEKETEPKAVNKPAKSGLPPAPYRQIIDLYHEILPELPRVIVETEDRKRLVKSFWNWVLTSTKASGARRAETASEAIEYFKIYFDLARGNDFVMGRTERSKDHRNWKASIDYLLSDKGKKQIIENA